MTDQQQLEQFINSMILSASGWRGIFAKDGKAESKTINTHLPGATVAIVAASVFHQYYTRILGKQPTIALGMDSRPTGGFLLDVVDEKLFATGTKVYNTGIIAAPEIMAYTAETKKIDGFFYISASHNPAGYNGFKFGLKSGALEGFHANHLIELFKKSIATPEVVRPSLELAKMYLKSTNPHPLSVVPEYKKVAEKTYMQFCKTVATASTKPTEQNALVTAIHQGLTTYPLSVVAEFNGSARALSVDSDFLNTLGVKTLRLQETPGKFIHPIVPEGKNLHYCKEQLEKAHAKDPSFLLGYVPDCDGDRGNIVAIDPATGKGVVPSAQEVFALVVLAELTFMASLQREKPQALVVNGPTSRRIDAIASCYGVKLYRTEVGEANVLAGARKAREDGYEVRILGEGANGGNITHPGTMRDPLNTLTSLIKILVLRGDGAEGPGGLFYQWCVASGQNDKYRHDFSLIDILNSIPPYTTTNSYEPRALMQVKQQDHRKLKAAYTNIFLAQWQEKQAELKERFGITSWRAFSTRGTEIQEGLEPFDADDNRRGGLTIEFLGPPQGAESQEPGSRKAESQSAKQAPTTSVTDVIWMRGSGTEPVFRIWADCKGNAPEREAWFLAWHRSMIEAADTAD